jgi:hypothetical protein
LFLPEVVIMGGRFVLLLVILTLAGTPPVLAFAGQPPAPSVRIMNLGVAGGRVLQVDVATSGVPHQDAEPATAAFTVWLDGVPAHAVLPLIDMPERFTMNFDLPQGVVSVGGIQIGSFHPVLPFDENMRFPVEVRLRSGTVEVADRQDVTILLPTVIVPGYLNELGSRDEGVIAGLRRYGYTASGASPTLFWFTYPSRHVSLDEGGRALAAYVRRVVLPASYASKINVIGYSVGGLVARWNIGYDVDGWSGLVNRLVLVGVPNEGTVMAYLDRQAPTYLPIGSMARTRLAATLEPTFPFWRPDAGHSWETPPARENTLLEQLNTRPLPSGVRVYLVYGSNDPDHVAGPQTTQGVTGQLPDGELSFGAGDGIVLAASAQGLPINGAPGVPGLAERAVLRIDVGPVYHTRVLDAGAAAIGRGLVDRFRNTVDEVQDMGQPGPSAAEIQGQQLR